MMTTPELVPPLQATTLPPKEGLGASTNLTCVMHRVNHPTKRENYGPSPTLEFKSVQDWTLQLDSMALIQFNVTEEEKNSKVGSLKDV
ncbi:hypothetical protein TNCV_691041 [Trichonephila clavipes]|nr:hypothetical protein TNCV_691041 [Trichonephila clavipes]